MSPRCFKHQIWLPQIPPRGDDLQPTFSAPRPLVLDLWRGRCDFSPADNARTSSQRIDVFLSAIPYFPQNLTPLFCSAFLKSDSGKREPPPMYPLVSQSLSLVYRLFCHTGNLFPLRHRTYHLECKANFPPIDFAEARFPRSHPEKSRGKAGCRSLTSLLLLFPPSLAV